MSTEAAVTLVIAVIIDVVFVALTLAMRFGRLIDVCTPYGTDTPEPGGKSAASARSSAQRACCTPCWPALPS